MNTDTKRLSYTELQTLLNKCYGSEKFIQTKVFGMVKGVIITEGVSLFRESAGGQGAYWFIDMVNSYLPKIKATKDYFSTIVLEIKAGGQATFKVLQQDSNGENKVIIKQGLATDVQRLDKGLTEYKFFLIEENSNYIMMLPREY